MADEDDFLMGGGGTSAKFEEVGTVVRGKILRKALRQQTDINTKEPLTWADGRPRQQLVVALQTDEIDPDIEDDDGVRNLYIKFKMREAVAEAVKKAKAKTLDIGGELAVKYTGNAKPTRRGVQGAKLYKAKYTPPDPAEYLDDELADGDVDEVDEAPPPRKAAAKRAPAKKATRRTPEPETDEDDDLEPAPPRKRAAKKAAARTAAVDEFSDEDDADEDEGF